MSNHKFLQANKNPLLCSYALHKAHFFLYMDSVILTQTSFMAAWITKLQITELSLLVELILHKTKNRYG